MFHKPGFHAILLAAALIAGSAGMIHAQATVTDSTKREDIERLIRLSGSEKLQQAMVDQLMTALKPIFAKAASGNEQAQKMMDRLQEIMTDEFKKQNFAEITLNLYDKYFTQDEIKELIHFYESPLGKKSIEVMPALTQEAMALGIQKGRAVADKAMTRWSEEFPEVKPFLKTPGGQ